MATWTIEEAVALSFGKEPEVVSWATLESHGQTVFGEQYRLLRKLAFRAVEAGRLPDPCPPLDFIEWMHQNRLVFPAELANAVTEQLAESTALRKQSERNKTAASAVGDDRTVNPKSFNTLLKLVGGMAVAIYKYDPSAKKSEVPKLIQSDLDLIGVSLDLDTIRKWTKAAVKTAEIL